MSKTAVSVRRADILEGAEITLDAGLPGFPTVRRFRCRALEGAEGFSTLTCVETAGPTFVVVRPDAVIPGYAPALGPEVAARLGVEDVGRLEVRAIVTPVGPSGRPTANLLAPLVIDRTTLRAAQVVLDDCAWGVAVPLPPR